jgi:hypothetical protein
MLWAAVAAAVTMPGAASGQYHRYDELQAALEALVAAHPEQAVLTEYHSDTARDITTTIALQGS